MGVTQDAGTNLNQLQLQARQRPVGRGLRQRDAAQERGQIVGEGVQLQPDLVVAEPLARQPRPAEGVLSFLDMLLGGVDRGTEPLTSAAARKSLVSRIAEYGDLIASGRYRDRYGLKANLLVLWVFETRLRAAKFLELVGQYGGTASGTFLAQSLDAAGHPNGQALPNWTLFKGPWLRANSCPASISTA